MDTTMPQSSPKHYQLKYDISLDLNSSAMQPDIRIIIFSLSGLISDPIDVFPIDFEAVPDPETPFRLQHSIRTMFLCFM